MISRMNFDAIERPHPDRESLAEYLRGPAVDDTDELSIHLAGCEPCRATLEEVDDNRATIEEVGDLLRTDAPESGTAVPEVPPESLSRWIQPSDDPGSLGRFDRYEVRRVLGSGGMGIVLEVDDPGLDRRAALKVLAPELAGNAAARQRFAREARSAAAVVHPHVIEIRTVDEHDGLPYLVMPAVEGCSVQDKVDRTGPLEIVAAVRIATQIAEGLAAAHARGLVHRDIKPGNVLLENGVERVQITDFGLARAADDASLTRSGIIAGTPQYMSPEQARGDDVDARSDQFSLGGVIYFMLTGRPPFRAETTMGVLSRIATDEPRRLSTIRPDVPDWLETIVGWLMAKNRTDRFATTAEVADLLGRWLAHLQTPETNPRPADPPPRTASGASGGSRLRCSLLAAAGGAAAFLLGAVVTLQTDTGTIRIASDAEVPIIIERDDEVVRQMTVSREAESFTVASGRYRIRLVKPRDDDQIRFEPNVFELSRGQEQLVQVNFIEHAATTTDEPDRLPQTFAGSITDRNESGPTDAAASVRNGEYLAWSMRLYQHQETIGPLSESLKRLGLEEAEGDAQRRVIEQGLERLSQLKSRFKSDWSVVQRLDAAAARRAEKARQRSAQVQRLHEIGLLPALKKMEAENEYAETRTEAEIMRNLLVDWNSFAMSHDIADPRNAEAAAAAE